MVEATNREVGKVRGKVVKGEVIPVTQCEVSERGWEKI